MIKPYYTDAHVTLYHADARLLVPALVADGATFDLLLTDPPYGIGENEKKVASRGKLAAPRDYGAFDWDKEPPPPWLMDAARSLARHQIIWGGNYFKLPPASCWLVWDKLNGANDFADAELAWTNLKKAVRLLQYRWAGMLQEKMGADKEARLHPTQKPLDVMTWAITQAPADVLTILDPFAGSGTTGRAAKDLGRKAVLIEREEKYCEVAAARMAQEILTL